MEQSEKFFKMLPSQDDFCSREWRQSLGYPINQAVRLSGDGIDFCSRSTQSKLFPIELLNWLMYFKVFSVFSGEIWVTSN